MGGSEIENNPNNPWPLVSIVIPAYNAEKYILSAIRSIAEQQYENTEILVIDDGSTDSTADLVQQHAPTVKIIWQANAGAAAARNTGLKHARGEYICLLDADDGWFPGKLKAQAEYLMKHPEVGVVYHRWMIWKPDASGNFVEPARPENPKNPGIDSNLSGWIYPKLLFDCVVHTSTVMIRAELVKEIGYFDTSLATGEDYDYWLRISRRYQIHKLAATYSYYRATPGSLTNLPTTQNNEYQVINGAIKKWGLESPDGVSVPKAQMDRRLSKLMFDFGYSNFHNGNYCRARPAFFIAFCHSPFNWRTLAYLCIASIKCISNRRH